jgi:hypothetical protein
MGVYINIFYLRHLHTRVPLLGRLLALPANFRPAWKGLPGANFRTLSACLLMIMKKSFIALTRCVNIIVLLFFTTRVKHLQVLSIGVLTCGLYYKSLYNHKLCFRFLAFLTILNYNPTVIIYSPKLVMIVV